MKYAFIKKGTQFSIALYSPDRPRGYLGTRDGINSYTTEDWVIKESFITDDREVEQSRCIPLITTEDGRLFLCYILKDDFSYFEE